MSKWTKTPPSKSGYYFTKDLRYPSVPYKVEYVPYGYDFNVSQNRRWWTTPIKEPE